MSAEASIDRISTQKPMHAHHRAQIYTIPDPRVVMWPPVFGVLILHLYWGYGWVQQQQRRRAKRANGEPFTPSSMASPAFKSNGNVHGGAARRKGD